jgi:NADH-quinone oxidoreductase subunit K
MEITVHHYTVVSCLLFVIGIFGVLTRKNMLIILMSIELMLSASNLALVAFSRYGSNLDGQVAVLFVFIIAAAEAAVGLGIVIAAFRHTSGVRVTAWKELKG